MRMMNLTGDVWINTDQVLFVDVNNEGETIVMMRDAAQIDVSPMTPAQVAMILNEWKDG